jgi:hypothetical protein
MKLLNKIWLNLLKLYYNYLIDIDIYSIFCNSFYDKYVNKGIGKYYMIYNHEFLFVDILIHYLNDNVNYMIIYKKSKNDNKEPDTYCTDNQTFKMILNERLEEIKENVIFEVYKII